MFAFEKEVEYFLRGLFVQRCHVIMTDWCCDFTVTGLASAYEVDARYQCAINIPMLCLLGSRDESNLWVAHSID